MSRHELIQLASGLREAADWIEANADLPVRIFTGHVTVNLGCQTAEQLAIVARAFGAFEKHAGDPLFWITKKINSIVKIDANTNRDSVCKKVEKQVVRPAEDERIIPAKPEEVVPAKPERTETVFVWECPESILNPDSAVVKEVEEFVCEDSLLDPMPEQDLTDVS